MHHLTMPWSDISINRLVFYSATRQNLAVCLYFVYCPAWLGLLVFNLRTTP
jgi:hypothetical protein